MGGLAKSAAGVVSPVLDMFGLGAPKIEMPAPQVAPPTTMPTPSPDDEAAKRARRRAAAAQQARGGRASTILTDTLGETLG